MAKDTTTRTSIIMARAEQVAAQGCGRAQYASTAKRWLVRAFCELRRLGQHEQARRVLLMRDEILARACRAA